MEKSKVNEMRVWVRLTEDTVKRLNEIAERDCRKLSGLLRYWIEERLRNESNP